LSLLVLRLTLARPAVILLFPSFTARFSKGAGIGFSVRPQQGKRFAQAADLEESPTRR
jgi:hypothetical protein